MSIKFLCVTLPHMSIHGAQPAHAHHAESQRNYQHAHQVAQVPHESAPAGDREHREPEKPAIPVEKDLNVQYHGKHGYKSAQQ